MKKLVLANRDYGPATSDWPHAHTSTEGLELQLGLEHAGWTLVGAGYGPRGSHPDARDVRKIIDEHRPDIVFVQDKRDWDPHFNGCFNKKVGYSNLDYLKQHPTIFKACILKDAASVRQYQQIFFDEADADAAVVYYSPSIVVRLNPWIAMKKKRVVRIYHSVNRDVCDAIEFRPRERRLRCIVTGATSNVYPLRTAVMNLALRHPQLDIKVFGHPGYGNGGSHTNSYLEEISKYRVHIATASRFGFALRKIIESVAVGAVPVTNLPVEDLLPEIDGALIRVPFQANPSHLLHAVNRADEEWNEEDRRRWAIKARQYYDYRAAGLRLDRALVAARQAKLDQFIEQPEEEELVQ